MEKEINKAEKAKTMHAVIVREGAASGRCAEAEKAEGEKVFLAEEKYSEGELEAFRKEASKWVLRCKGHRYFLADSDSGEDAEGYYCRHFEPAPERAVFENGKPVGFYLCYDGLRYSGNDRASFGITHWGFPGSDVFGFVPWGAETHLFLFDEPATHEWKDWRLLKREPGAEYGSYLEF